MTKLVNSDYPIKPATIKEKNTTPVEEPLLVKIGSKWVNLEAWKKTHPGGASTLERFKGQDATDAFASIHSKEAVEMVNKMKNVEASVSDRMKQEHLGTTKIGLAFREFRAELEKEGWFERNWFWDAFYVMSITILAFIGTLISYQHPYIASVLIGIAMQQAGWIGHDYVHGRGKVSKVLGVGIGGLFNAFSSDWWSAKHNKHHVHTNQMGIDDDIQNDPILHLWVPEAEKDHALRPYQHLYYHIVYAFLFFSWRIQSFQHAWKGADKLELLLMSINYLWLLYLPWKVSLCSVLLGGFLVAEVVTATHQSEEILNDISFNFVEDQFATTRDVDIDNFFINYLWGGMQYQLEHHLFPTIPKYKYPKLKLKVKKFALENDLMFRSSSLLEIVGMNYDTMRRFAITKSH